MIGVFMFMFKLSHWVHLPLPPITKGYRFYLDVRHAQFKSREEPTEDEQDERLMETDEKRQDFQSRKEKYGKKKADNKEIQEKVKVNNRDILMAQQVECIGAVSYTHLTLPTILLV